MRYLAMLMVLAALLTGCATSYENETGTGAMGTGAETGPAGSATSDYRADIGPEGQSPYWGYYAGPGGPGTPP